MAFWLYSSGTTGFPKGAVHLHHDMLVAADLYARQTIGLRETDVSFSVAKLFFAYGLGNGLYFPLRAGGDDRPAARSADAGEDLRDDRPLPADRVLQRADQLRGHCCTRPRRPARTSLGRVRMCVSAGEPLPKHLYEQVARTVRRRDPRRHRLHRDPAHLHLQPPGPAHGPAAPARSCPATRRKIVDDDGRESCRRRGRHAAGSRATASPPATGTSTKRPRTPSAASGSTRTTSSSSTRTATSGTPAAPTT